MAERTGAWKLSADERMELAAALLRRTLDERVTAAHAAFRRAFPTASDAMIGTATHHVYVDGPGDTVLWLADAELFLRDPNHELCRGVTWNLLYHIYNWHMFRELLPEAKSGMIERLDEIKEFIDEGSLDAAKGAVDDLKEMLEGNLNPPNVE